MKKKHTAKMSSADKNAFYMSKKRQMIEIYNNKNVENRRNETNEKIEIMRKNVQEIIQLN